MTEPTKRRLSFEIVASDTMCGVCPQKIGTWCDLFQATLAVVHPPREVTAERLRDCIDAEEK